MSRGGTSGQPDPIREDYAVETVEEESLGIDEDDNASLQPPETKAPRRVTVGVSEGRGRHNSAALVQEG